MRIIIVQYEIEEAIRNYILNQIDIKEGQTINIEFKNTRGDDGATAEINISIPNAALVKTEEKPPLTPTAVTKVAAPDAQAIPPTPSPVKEAAIIASIITDNEPMKPIERTKPYDEGRVEPKDDKLGKSTIFGNNVASEKLEEIPAPSKSLFANLTKPVNPKE